MSGEREDVHDDRCDNAPENGRECGHEGEPADEPRDAKKRRCRNVAERKGYYEGDGMDESSDAADSSESDIEMNIPLKNLRVNVSVSSGIISLLYWRWPGPSLQTYKA